MFRFSRGGYPPGALASKAMLTNHRPFAGAALSGGQAPRANEGRVGAAVVSPETILSASMLFNLVLCFVHTNLLALSPLPVMAAEAAILGAAFLVPFALNSRRPGRMDFLLILLLASWLLLSILRQDVEPKLFRDVAIMPIFVLLGVASRGETLHRRLFRLHMIVLIFALWEAISLSSFVSVFSIGDYFAHTRGSDTADWWVDNGLYLSAVRPEARFLFPSLPLHRLSSVFLEPVSLGNYVMIATIWLAGFWRRIPRRMRITAACANVLLLIGCDSRMATITCVIILLAVPIRRWIPSVLPVLTAPIVIAAMFLAVALFGLQAGLDDFGGRIAHSVGTFRAFDLDNYAGLSLSQMKAAEDAGFAYVIMSQSLITAVVLWGGLFLRRMVTPESRFIHLAAALYVSLNLTVSWSLFSIKTAALLWFLLGRAIREDMDAVQDRAAEPPRPSAVARSGTGRLAGSAHRVFQ